LGSIDLGGPIISSIYLNSFILAHCAALKPFISLKFMSAPYVISCFTIYLKPKRAA
jgi:hypothetical protein